MQNQSQTPAPRELEYYLTDRADALQHISETLEAMGEEPNEHNLDGILADCYVQNDAGEYARAARRKQFVNAANWHRYTEFPALLRLTAPLDEDNPNAEVAVAVNVTTPDGYGVETLTYRTTDPEGPADLDALNVQLREQGWELATADVDALRVRRTA